MVLDHFTLVTLTFDPVTPTSIGFLCYPSYPSYPKLPKLPSATDRPTHRPTLCSVHDSIPNINCTVNNSGFERSICIDHHVYDELSGAWVKQNSKLQPFLNMTAKVTT